MHLKHPRVRFGGRIARVALLFFFFRPISASAGGGPESVLLVVNPLSADSMTIANHYAQWRQIPQENLFFLEWDPKTQTTDVETFRRRILVPVLHYLEKRHLLDQIDCVAYSSDFPWGIDLKKDMNKFIEQLKKEQASKPAEGESGAEKPKETFEWPKYLTPTGSLTGLTYAWQPAAISHPAYFELRGNFYTRPVPPPGRVVPHLDIVTSGFRGNREYGPHGDIVASGGRRYFLSAMLGVTAGRGNTTTEVLHYLQRSVAADGNHPKGTIYFMQNNDVRSKARHDLFPAAVEAIRKAGVAAEILEGTIPMHKKDVQGAMIGAAQFDWKASGSTILPGALCEHFTSFGGIFHEGAGQTPLSEFLRYGAAGAAGAVAEPYSIPEKFPAATVQVHYVRGCTLAEAFYQSVQGPYQLLLVGDPLCRPWAEIPRVAATGVEPGAVVRGDLSITPRATLDGGAAVGAFELFIDGFRVAACKPGESFAFDSAKLADGWHELRVVGVGPEPIESRGWTILPVRASNHDRTIEASLASPERPRADRPIALAVRSPGSAGVLAVQGNRIVGRVGGEGGTLEIPAGTFGAGPVQVRAVGLGPNGPHTNVLAEPLEFVVEPAAP